MRCSTCGRPVSQGSLLCPFCGASVKSAFDQLVGEVELARSLLDGSEMTRLAEEVKRSAELQAATVQAALHDVTSDFTTALEAARQFQLPSTYEIQEMQRTILEAVPKLPDVDALWKQLEATASITDSFRDLAERAVRDWQTMSVPAMSEWISQAVSALLSLEVAADHERLKVDGVEVDPAWIERLLAGRDLEPDSLASLIEQEGDPEKKGSLAAVLLWLLKHVLFPFLISLAAAEFHSCHHPAERKEAVRIMRKESEQRAAQVIAAGVPREALKSFRLVTASTLNVHEKPARRSSHIGELHLGQVVYAVRTKKRSWTLVEWSSEDGEVRLRGWVFSRYLNKLRLPPKIHVAPTIEQPEPEPKLVPAH